MLTSVEMTALLRAQDPLVFTGDVPALESAAFALASTDFEGAVVLLPETLPSDPAAAVPALLFSRVNRLRDWQVPQRQNMALVLIQEHGASLQSLAFFKEAPPDNRREHHTDFEEIPEPAPTGAMATSMITLLRQVDLRQRFSLQAAGGQLTLLALCFDRTASIASATVAGTAHSLPAGPAAPLAVSFGSPSLRKAKLLPIYDQTRSSPPPPVSGVNVTIEASARVTPHGFTLRGTFNTAAQAYQIKPMPELMQFGQVKHLVVAVVPITFVILSLNDAKPHLVTWNLPVYGNEPPAVGGALRGFFEVELLGPEEPGLPGGPKVLYAVMGEQLVGPVRFGE